MARILNLAFGKGEGEQLKFIIKLLYYNYFNYKLLLNQNKRLIFFKLKLLWSSIEIVVKCYVVSLCEIGENFF
jgi:hypothetical protein